MAQESEIKNEDHKQELSEYVAAYIEGANFQLNTLIPDKNRPTVQLHNPDKLHQQTATSLKSLNPEISSPLQEYKNLKLAIESLAWKEEIDINLKVSKNLLLKEKLEDHLFKLMKSFIKYWKAQKRISISFEICKRGNEKIQFLLLKSQQLELSDDFVSSLKILIKPFGGIFSTQDITQKNSICITYPLFFR